MGPRLMDQSLQILLRNKGSDIKRSPLGGLKRMETWSISFKPSRRVREFQNLEGKAANAPHPTQLQRKALTCSCSVESSRGSYGKDRTWRRNSIRPNQTETQLKRSRWKSTRTRGGTPGKALLWLETKFFWIRASQMFWPLHLTPTLLSNKANTHEGFCSRSMLQDHFARVSTHEGALFAPGACSQVFNRLNIVEHFAGWKFCSRGWSIPMKSLAHTEELCSRSMLQEQNHSCVSAYRRERKYDHREKG